MHRLKQLVSNRYGCAGCLLSLRSAAIAGVLSLSPLLSSCSWLFGEEGLYPDKSSDYLTAKESPPIELPDDLSRRAIRNEYPIPELDVAQVLPDSFIVPRVEALDAVETQGSVRVQRLDQHQWILVNTAVSQVWPLVIDFLQENGIPLSRRDGVNGVIETDWLSVDEGDFVERYRFSFSQGVQADSTEIGVTQLATKRRDGVLPVLDFGDVSSRPSRENHMVNLLAEQLAAAPTQVSHSLLASGIGSASKVSLLYGDAGEPYLSLVLPFDRAWAALNLALGKASYRVSDVDRSRGLYYVRYTPQSQQDQKKGFFSRWFGRDEKPAGRDIEKTLEDFVVEGEHDGVAMNVRIRRELDPPLRINEQAFILKRIQGKIS